MLQKKEKTRMRNTAVLYITILLLFSVHTASADFVMPAQPAGTPGDFDAAILNMTDWVLGFVAALAVLALVWGGINYVTSGGSEEQTRTGKQTIKYALLGLIIAGIAWALVNVIVTTIL